MSTRRTIQELEAEIEALGERREELLPSLEEARNDHREAQERLLASDPTLAPALVSLRHAAVLSLQSTVSEIDRRVRDLESQLESARTEARAAEQSARMRAALGELNESEAIYRQLRTQIDTTLQNLCGELVHTFVRWVKLRNEITSLRQKLNLPGVKQRVIATPDKLQFGQLIDQCAQSVLNRERPGWERRSRAKAWHGSTVNGSNRNNGNHETDARRAVVPRETPETYDFY